MAYGVGRSDTLLPTVYCRWLSIRLESLGAFCTFVAAVVAVEQQGHNAALMGLLLTYALQVIKTDIAGCCSPHALQLFSRSFSEDACCAVAPAVPLSQPFTGLKHPTCTQVFTHVPNCPVLCHDSDHSSGRHHTSGRQCC